MTKRDIKKEVAESYKDDILQSEIVDELATRLKRKDLKSYIKALKAYEEEKTAYISIPMKLSDEQRQTVEEMFPNKRIVYTIDKTLGVGIKIRTQDSIYDYTIKDVLEKMSNYITQI